MSICPKCGLPLQACVCENISKTNQQIEVKIEKRRFGKMVTIVGGVDSKDIKEIAKRLKEKLACGGTIKNNLIELQGDHKNRIKLVLVDIGFDPTQIIQ